MRAAGWAALLVLAACGDEGAAAPDAGDPGVGTWRSMSDVDAPAPRADANAVWTGSELIVWGGGDAAGYRQDGAAYDPVLDRWRPIAATGAPSARGLYSAVWTGTEMLIFGGAGPGSDGQAFDLLGDGAAYAPASDRWRPIAAPGAPRARAGASSAWTGSEWVLFGGAIPADGAASASDVAAYDPASDAWRPVAAEGAPSQDALVQAVWSGDRVLAFGFQGREPLGVSYDPGGDAWSTIAATSAPDIVAVRAFWTGTELLVWGKARAAIAGQGARYRPGTAAWTPFSAEVGEQAIATGASAVFTGRQLVIWGGLTSRGTSASGVVYDLAADTWQSTAPRPSEDGRSGHVAVWTGREMLVWGGFRNEDGAYVPTGLRYVPEGGAASP